MNIDIYVFILFNTYPALYHYPRSLSLRIIRGVTHPSPQTSAMEPRNKLIVTVALLLLLGGLGAADYLYQGGEYVGSVADDGTTTSDDNTELPPGAVVKNTGPSIEETVAEQRLTAEPSGDLSLLAQIITDDTEIKSMAILSDGDRAGSVTWVETGDVKTHFIALKDALLGSFSSDMRDLRDETMQQPGEPVRNVLTFIDPGLSEERIVFVRVRERLFEFHLAEGKEEVMNGFIEALTTN